MIQMRESRVRHYKAKATIRIIACRTAGSLLYASVQEESADVQNINKLLLFGGRLDEIDKTATIL